MGKRSEKMTSEIVRRRIREMYPQGFTVQDIASVVNKTPNHIRKLVAQEFPEGRPADVTAHFQHSSSNELP